MSRNHRSDRQVYGQIAPAKPIEMLEGRRLLAAVLLADVDRGQTHSWNGFVEFGNTAYFQVAADGDIMGSSTTWETDGTPGGTRPAPHIGMALGAVADEGGGGGETLLMTRRGTTRYSSLWASDGTPDGAVLLKDDVFIESFHFTGERMYFVEYKDSNAWSFWTTDGTPQGTVKLGDYTGWHPYDKIAGEEGKVFFAGGHGVSVTDGTVAGTRLVPDAGATMVVFDAFEVMNGVLYYNSGGELWRADGTAGGTMRVADPDPNGDGDWVELFTAVGDQLFFMARDGRNGSHLWVSDGTAGGTHPVLEPLFFRPPPANSGYGTAGGLAYYRQNLDAKGYELWRSDGTEAGTFRVTDVSRGQDREDSFFGSLTDIDGVLYFTSGGDVWRTDGTRDGTAKVTGAETTSASVGAARDIGYLNRRLLIAAFDPEFDLRVSAMAWPTADARGPHEDHPWPAFYRVAPGQSVVLKGHWSTDPDFRNELLTHTWDMDGDGIFGETGIAAERGDEAGMYVRFSAAGLAPGTYPVKLRVVNTGGFADEDEVDVVVTGGGEVKRIVGGDGGDSWALGASEDTFYVYDRNAPGNDPVYAWPIESVAAVEFVGLGGDDYLTVSGEVEMPVRFDGGGGYDRVGVGCDNYDFAGNWEELRAWDGYGIVLHEDVTLDRVEVNGDAPLTLAPGANMTVRVRSLEIDEYNGSKLELNDNTLIVTPEPAELDAVLARVEQWVRDGRVWQGDRGILSYTAARDPRRLTGVAVGVRDGEIVVKRAYNGDANLDGRVNADDYFRIDSGFLAQPQNPKYAQGDFNDDGRINADDYFLIDQAFLGQGAPAAAAAARGAGAVGARVVVERAGRKRAEVRPVVETVTVRARGVTRRAAITGVRRG